MWNYLLKFLTVLSLLLCVGFGWAWKRSYTVIDIVSHDRFVERGCILRGFGSYRGALVIGSIDLPLFYLPKFSVSQRSYGIDKTGDKTRAAVASARGWIGFGSATGTIQLPLVGSLIKTRPMPYRIIYLPYYFLMLVTAVLPVWHGVAAVRRVPLPQSRSASGVAQPAAA